MFINHFPSIFKFMIGLLLIVKAHGFEIKEFTYESAFDDPYDFTHQTYCYFVFQSLIEPKVMTPQLFGQFVQGGTLSNSQIPVYEKWLKKNDGIACQKNLDGHFKSIQTDLSRPYSIFLNKKAISAQNKTIQRVLTHERLHVLFALKKPFQHKIKRRWLSMSPEQREQFIMAHEGYDFTKENVTLREFFSYTFEGSFEEGLRFLLSPLT